MFSRVLVGNRGEVAVRVIRALHEQGIESVAVYSTADRESLHVALADRAVCIGPPTAAQSYLKIPALIAAAGTTGCEAVHPGWGFLAENPAFAEACADNDLVFIGPTPDTLARMGDKSAAKREMAAAGLPLVPGTEGPATLAEARTAAAEAGYPVLLKAAAGGGGKGMRLVGGPDELEGAYSTAAAEAEAAFGDASLYVEKAISPARHVEIQVLADAEGNVLTLGERECSIQRRHQKLIEESPSAALTPKLREEMESAAEIACDAIGRDVRVSRRAGRLVLLHRAQRAAASRAPGERALHGDRPRARAATHRRRRIARADGARAAARARDRAPDQRRGPGPRLHAEPGPARALPAAARPGGARRLVRQRGLLDPAVLRLAAREADRLGRRPTGRDRARSQGIGRVRCGRRAYDDFGRR
jgi:D-alanine-D-alanine ligase-like ATP-grasp enzyme